MAENNLIEDIIISLKIQFGKTKISVSVSVQLFAAMFLSKIASLKILPSQILALLHSRKSIISLL